jgi:hypothetical protein
VLNYHIFFQPEKRGKDLLTLLLEKVTSKDLLLRETVGMNDQFSSTFGSIMSTVLAFVALKRSHFRLIYNYLGSEAFDSKENSEKEQILVVLLRTIKYMYHFLANKNLRPPVYYLLPTKESFFQLICTKASSKLHLEESGHLLVWVNLQSINKSESRTIFSWTNQMGEGLRLQVREDFLEVVFSRRISSLASVEDDSLTQETYPAQRLDLNVWNYIVMAYEYRKCRPP